MGRRCCIAGCQSSSRLAEHQGVTYHSFPLDASIRSLWIKYTRLNPERQITKSVLVCSRHFRRNDFQPIRNGKYLLKAGIIPTVFPWGKLELSQVEADQIVLKNSAINNSATSNANTSNCEDVTKATVAATVAQILAETAELNAAATGKSKATQLPVSPSAVETSNTGNSAEILNTSKTNEQYVPATYFAIGARLEAKRSDGRWCVGRVANENADGTEVLVRYDRAGRNKQTQEIKSEWILKKNCRQRRKSHAMQAFELGERCLARWSGPHKFPGIVQKLLARDTYQVLFDDGYTKNVRGIHMKKMGTPTLSDSNADTSSDRRILSPNTVENSKLTNNTTKKRNSMAQRKDWPLLDMTKLNLDSLNLPKIPSDGEWTCHWVNDQPIGTEGFLIVGEHRKPTVIVDDWRLPPGWIKHMYQRSNVLGKWDVILVSPSGKRFRSKSDLKIFLEEQGQVYNPDIYDFSIHRRRAKDINAYVYTQDYKPQQSSKPKPPDMPLEVTLEESETPFVDPPVPLPTISTTRSTTTSQYIETPVATLVPPIELMSQEKSDVLCSTREEAENDNKEQNKEDGYAYIGALKVQIIDHLFRCPHENCLKNFRKEDHVQIHIKHYHKDLAKLLGTCPKMQELAVKRTHPTSVENGHQPKNQIPNQQFFAKLHQQDLQQSRAFRRSAANLINNSNTASVSPIVTASASPKTTTATTKDVSVAMVPVQTTSVTTLTAQVKKMDSIKTQSELEFKTKNTSSEQAQTPENLTSFDNNTPIIVKSNKNNRFSPTRRVVGPRKSSRQRTTRRYLIAGQTIATPNIKASMQPSNTFAVSAEARLVVSDMEETRQSFNITPDVRPPESKRRRMAAATTPVSSIDSPADSGSTPTLNDIEVGSASAQNDQYIKENGEIIKIVHMRQEEIINCVCGYGEEDGLMIQCELCLCWQHGTCNGIIKESDVPEKYVCFICRNPKHVRKSMRFKHDQDWLYEGKLPVANYHIINPNLTRVFNFLKHSHTLTGNLLEIKRFMHSLQVKINIANNRVHPKLYLWAKKWDEDGCVLSDTKANTTDAEDTKSTAKRASKLLDPAMPKIPQPEAAINPEECQVRLIEHIKVQQKLVSRHLDKMETEIAALENDDELTDVKDSDISLIKEALAVYIKELETMKNIAKVNSVNNIKD